LTSSTLLLFPAASGASDPGQEAITVTQVQIAASTPVLQRAGQSVRPRLSIDEVRAHVAVDAKTANLLEIRASNTNARQAQRLSQAVADAYIATLENNVNSINGVPPELSSRQQALTKQLTDVGAQIAATARRVRTESPTSSDGIRDGQLEAELINLQADLAVRLDKVKDAIQQASSGAWVVPNIIQPAAAATGPGATQRLVTWTLACGLLVAGATALVLVIRRRRDPRVRAFDDLADAIGSSLLGAVRGHPQRSVAGWLALFETYDAPASEAWAFRQILRALLGPLDVRDGDRAATRQGPGRLLHPRALNIVAVAGDHRAVAIGPQLAVFAASLGISTRCIVTSRHDAAASLWAACTSDRRAQLRPGLILDVVGTEDVEAASGRDGVSAHPAADLTIALIVADVREPTLPLLPAAATVLAISPGFATREELARLAVAVDDAGRRIDGVVAADRDPSDRTTGRRTLDQRAIQAPLPIRVTGPN
jgi:hypothetical protein